MGDTKKLLSGSSIIFIGTIVGSIFAYVFNMLVGRLLGPVQYGEFSALMSLLTVLSVGSGTVLTITMRYSGELFASKNFGVLNRLFKIFTKYVLFIGVLFCLIGLAMVRPISEFFGITHPIPVIITLSSFIFGFLIVVNRGVLQGTQRFTAMAWTTSLEAAIRLMIGIALVKIGFAVSGAIAGTVLATVIAYFITLMPVRKVLNTKSKKMDSFALDKKEIINYSWPTLVATLLLVVGMNIDVILIKHYFDSETAGLYAAISTIGKIILYATGPIASVMFPMISEHKAKGEKHYRIFMASLLLTLVGALFILGIYYVAPGKVITLMYGSEYASFYYLLPQIGFAILLYSLVSLMSSYFLSIKSFVFLPAFAAAMLFQIIAISYLHGSIEQVIKIIISSLGLLFVLMMSYYLFTKREQIFLHLRGENES